MLTRKDYIALFKDVAIQATQGTGIFPSVMLAQGIVESGNGNSVLAKKYNNHFGIKASSAWTGKTVNLQTREVVSNQDINIPANFRVYDSALDSYIDYVKFLQENPRYTAGGVFSATTPFDQLKALQASGYATDPNYATILNSVIEAEGLNSFNKAINYTVAITKQTVEKHPFVVGSIIVLFIVLIALLIKRRNQN